MSKIPISVVVWSREAMAASGVKGIDEIGGLTPGVGFDWATPFGAGAYTNLDIRGVTGRRGSTTSVFVDNQLRVPASQRTRLRAAAERPGHADD